MRSALICCLTLAVLLAVSCGLFGAQRKPNGRTVTIEVVDLIGTAIPHAEVRFSPIPEDEPDQLETAANGKLTLNLKPGSYTLVVACAGFKTSSTRITVNDAEGIQTVSVRLQIGDTGSPMVVEAEVVFEGLKAGYASCDVVQFNVRNVSRTELYVEVYAEEFKSGRWEYVDYPFDLTDPRSLYIKRVGFGPNTMPRGGSTSVKYDRCLKPKFVKGGDRSYIQAIKSADSKRGSSTLQRLRADVYGPLTQVSKRKLGMCGRMRSSESLKKR